MRSSVAASTPRTLGGLDACGSLGQLPSMKSFPSASAFLQSPKIGANGGTADDVSNAPSDAGSTQALWEEAGKRNIWWGFGLQSLFKSKRASVIPVEALDDNLDMNHGDLAQLQEMLTTYHFKVRLILTKRAFE